MKNSIKAALMLLGLVMAPPALAVESAKEGSGQLVVAESDLDDVSSDIQYAARKMLGFLSESRVIVTRIIFQRSVADVDLSSKQKEIVLSYLDDALERLNAMRDIPVSMEAVGLRFGRVTYGESSSYYIPIADESYARRNYERGPFWVTDMGMAVRNVRIVHVNIHVIPDTAENRILQARDYIKQDRYQEAKRELDIVLETSVSEVENAEIQPPLARLMDNVYLSRILIRQKNYDGARYTLQNAQSALDDYEQSPSKSVQKPEIEKLRGEIQDLNTIIQSKDPTLLKTAADKVEQWWDNLKTWTEIHIN